MTPPVAACSGLLKHKLGCSTGFRGHTRGRSPQACRISSSRTAEHPPRRSCAGFCVRWRSGPAPQNLTSRKSPGTTRRSITMISLIVFLERSEPGWSARTLGLRPPSLAMADGSYSAADQGPNSWFVLRSSGSSGRGRTPNHPDLRRSLLWGLGRCRSRTDFRGSQRSPTSVGQSHSHQRLWGLQRISFADPSCVVRLPSTCFCVHATTVAVLGSRLTEIATAFTLVLGWVGISGPAVGAASSNDVRDPFEEGRYLVDDMPDPMDRRWNAPPPPVQATAQQDPPWSAESLSSQAPPSALPAPPSSPAPANHVRNLGISSDAKVLHWPEDR